MENDRVQCLGLSHTSSTEIIRCAHPAPTEQTRHKVTQYDYLTQFLLNYDNIIIIIFLCHVNHDIKINIFFVFL